MKYTLLVISFLIVPSISFTNEVDSIEVGELYSRLVGLPQYAFVNDIDENKTNTFDEKFDQIFYHKDFIENKLATLVSRLSDETDDPFLNVDDYQVSLLLAMMSDVDFRSIFKNKYSIIDKDSGASIAPNILNDSGFEVLYRNYVEQDLKFDQTQESSFASGLYDGLFTTVGFGSRFYSDGTNRRPVIAIYDIFLCTKLESYKDPGLSMHYIGPDIDRAPGDKPHVFFEGCSSCHASVDSQRGYAAYLDYENGQMVLLDEVSEKYNRNPKGYGGYITTDNSWENLLTTPHYQEMFGWRTATVGKGVSSFADMIVSSEKFSECMAQKVAREICPANVNLNSDDTEQEYYRIARDFESKSYVFKELVKSVFRSPLLCSE